MTSRVNVSKQAEIRVLKTAEVDQVAGGFMGVDVSGMPDRSVVCGTMWLLNKLLGRFTPSRV